MITRLKIIKSKRSSFFLNFHIVEFYTSISKDLLLKTINFAKSVTPIQENFIETVLHCRMALLFNKNYVCVKKENPHFDIAMGSCDVAEVYELLGLYILDILTKKFGHDKVGLCRDDGLGCFGNLPESVKVKKKLSKIFEQSELSITVECNLRIKDFLDIAFKN